MKIFICVGMGNKELEEYQEYINRTYKIACTYLGGDESEYELVSCYIDEEPPADLPEDKIDLWLLSKRLEKLIDCDYIVFDYYNYRSFKWCRVLYTIATCYDFPTVYIKINQSMGETL